MGMQKSKVSRSQRDKRRTHDKVAKPTLSTDSNTGEVHRRHHITADGYYRGRQVLVKPVEADQDDQDEG
jgi:large subunit ribosomal protein L32